MILPAFTLAFSVLGADAGRVLAAGCGDFGRRVAATLMMSRYIQLAQENARLLALEKRNSASLHQRVEEQVRHMTQLKNQDALTGLANRATFMRQPEGYLRFVKPPQTVVVMVANVDSFKTINESYGASVGDNILKAVAQRIQEWGPLHVELARLGGDEFGLYPYWYARPRHGGIAVPHGDQRVWPAIDRGYADPCCDGEHWGGDGGGRRNRRVSAAAQRRDCAAPGQGAGVQPLSGV